MDELCPLCLKMGQNKKIRAVQINLEEAVWLCENEKCVWPFGYEEPSFLSRKVGDKRTNEWEVYKKVQKYVGPIPVSTELSLYTPPVTPSSDATLKETGKSDVLSGNISEKINSIQSLHPEKSTTTETSKITTIDDQIGQWLINTEPIVQPVPSVTSIFDIDGGELHPNKIILIESRTERKERDSVESELNSNETELRENESSKLTVLPHSKPTSEKKENCNIVTEIQTAVESNNKNLDQKIIIQKNPSDGIATEIQSAVKTETKNVELEMIEQLSPIDDTKLDIQNLIIPAEVESPKKLEKTNSQTIENLENEQKHITTIQVDGSLPITLSYNLIDLQKDGLTTSTPQKNNKGSLTHPKNDDNTKSPKKNTRSPIKRRVTSIGKKYEKFNFGALKKARMSKDSNNESNVTPPTTCNKAVAVHKIERIKIEKSVSLDVPVEPLSKIENNDNCELTTELGETFNLSSELDDILLEDYQNATENLNDDWLTSFFT